jgi:putative hydrolase
MRGYSLGLVREALELVDPDPRTMLRAISSAVDEVRAGRNPLDEGGLVGLFATPEQRGVLGQVQALMSVLEGHGNVVMDDLGREYVAGQERMSRVLSQRRQIGGVTGLLHKLLGIEQKMRQYEVGERFVRGVYDIAGRRAFDAVWEAPENLPTVPELSEPRLWLRRVDAARV